MNTYHNQTMNNTPARYCCTLEQSNRLRELGVDAPSMFTHYKTFRNEWSIAYSTGLGNESYPAYTVGELGEMLPDVHDNENLYYTIRDAGKGESGDIEGWSIFNFDSGEIVELHNVQVHLTESIARAAMLIHLLENNLITPSQVNNQLK